MANIGINAVVDNRDLSKGLAEAQNKVTSFGASITSGIGGGLAKLGLVAGGIGAVVSTISSVIGTPLKLAAENEKAAVSFKVLLGSAEQAETVMKGLKDFAASTPFEFPEIQASAKSLLALGYRADQLTPALRQLGDISSALDVPLQDLVKSIGKMKATDIIQGEDLNSLGEKGIPILKILAKQFGVTEAQVKDMASKSKIHFSDLQVALNTMTGKGSQFGGMMSEMSKTTSGAWSNAVDSFNATLTKVGTKLIEVFHVKDILDMSSSFFTAWGDGVMAVWDWVLAGFAEIQPVLSAIGDIFVECFTFVADIVEQAWTEISNIVKPYITWFQEAIRTALLVVEYGFKNWKTVLEIACKSAILGVVLFVNDTVHLFTVVIPNVLTWFWNNWRDIFQTLWNYTSTLFSNLGKNIVKIIKNIPGLIAGTTTFSELWTPLTEGFVNTIKELPDIPVRVATEFEKKYSSDIANMTKQLVDGYDKFKADKLSDAQKKATEATSKAKPDTKIPGSTRGASPGANGAGGTPSDDVKKNLAEAMQLGSKEARQALLMSRYGNSNSSPQKKVEVAIGENTKEVKGLRQDLKGKQVEVKDQLT